MAPARVRFEKPWSAQDAIAMTDDDARLVPEQKNAILSMIVAVMGVAVSKVQAA